ncbi:hypothetical protein C8J55DRAFT_497697 [Lentinula edodes]|uniref:Uncharacterized protein n=1 Tax=Lentinula lateritia TaxID=40482 RepID=A0A9W9E0W6_9AGAR|nr:hypothetical protein C8J55DRAFT_497697 [Lentinula edodes]
MMLESWSFVALSAKILPGILMFLPVGTPFAQACWFPVCRKPIPSILIQSVVERIAADLDIVSPPLHSLTWPERH